MLSPPVSYPGGAIVRKYLSVAVTAAISLSALVCLVLAAGADGIGPA
jgi:hypothetical protein